MQKVPEQILYNIEEVLRKPERSTRGSLDIEISMNGMTLKGIPWNTGDLLWLEAGWSWLGSGRSGLALPVARALLGVPF